jgi:hypothetical protein
MADLIKKSEAGAGFEVDPGDGEPRLAAHVFKHPRGVVFVEAGWCIPMSTKHNYHLLEGEIEGEGPWRVGPATFTEITEDSYLAQDWAASVRYEVASETCSRELAAQIAAREFP